ncbi:MAG: hypothetical protein K2J05_00505, partial [Muribaculaceae bacterium]|nr:hypothetical protein [Muribaculaceae bacterium]
LEYTQYLDSDGVLCLKVSIPANHLAEYRLFEISAIKNKDIDKHETFYYASGLIIQDPVDPVPSEVRDLMRIRINGEIYSSEYTYNVETGYEFANPGFAEILAKVESDDRWRMVILESDIVDYIDFTRPDIEDYLRQLSSAAFPMTRAASAGFANMGSNDIGYFAVYDNGDFKGSNICKGLTDLYSTFSIQNLKDYGMNDKISSIAVAYNYTDPNLCSVITVWDDAGWNNGDTSRSKHRLSIIASSSNRQVTYSSLKNVKCLNSSKNWNDRISSISCHFGYWGRSMLDY